MCYSLDLRTGNQLAIALGKRVYLWNASTSSIDELMQCSGADNFVTSVSWSPDGNYLSVGTNEADVQLWDTTQHKQLRTMRGHAQRGTFLRTPAETRIRSLTPTIQSVPSPGTATSSAPAAVTARSSTTTSALPSTTLPLSRVTPRRSAALSGRPMVSSSPLAVRTHAPSPSACARRSLSRLGNDNLLNIWDASSTAPKFSLDAHQAAVKAVAWCPWQQGLLASGGGTSDRCIRTWSSTTGACLNTVDTGSQVCALQWNPHQRELVSSHGFSENQLIVWKYPAMVRMAELRGHTSRVLHLALSPDGTTIASAAGDETLRFWKVFEGAEQKKVAAKKIGQADSHKLSSISLR